MSELKQFAAKAYFKRSELDWPGNERSYTAIDGISYIVGARDAEEARCSVIADVLDRFSEKETRVRPSKVEVNEVLEMKNGAKIHFKDNAFSDFDPDKHVAEDEKFEKFQKQLPQLASLNDVIVAVNHLQFDQHIDRKLPKQNEREICEIQEELVKVRKSIGHIVTKLREHDILPKPLSGSNSG